MILLLELVRDELANLGVLQRTNVSIGAMTTRIEATYHGGRVEHEVTVRVTDNDGVVNGLGRLVVVVAPIDNGRGVGDECVSRELVSWEHSAWEGGESLESVGVPAREDVSGTSFKMRDLVFRAQTEHANDDWQVVEVEVCGIEEATYGD